MQQPTMSKDKRQLEIIEFNDLPIVAKSITDNADEISLFLPVNVVFFVKRGSVKVYSGAEELFARPGDCFFISSFSNCKARKTLDSVSEGFESIIFFVDHATLANKSPAANFSNSKGLPSLVKLTSKTTRALVKIFEKHFAIKSSLSSSDLDYLAMLTEQLMKQVLKMTAASNSGDDADDFLTFLYNHVGLNITLEELASKYGLSTSSFHRLFVKKLGTSPHKWIKDQRLNYARCWMLFSQKSASEIYLDLGFEDISHFSREFKKKFGYNPSRTTKITSIDVIR